jgi:hypothetical protein
MGTGTYPRLWNTKVTLRWTTIDVQTAVATPNVNAGGLPLKDPRNPLHQVPTLGFKDMLGLLPDHSLCLDHSGAYLNAQINGTPAYHVPWEVSLGFVLHYHYVVRPAEQHNFFQADTETLHAPVIPSAVRQKLLDLDNTMRAVLSKVHVLFTNSATALSEPVKAAFPTPILVVGNTHRVVFPQIAGVLMSYPDRRASFMLEDPSNQRPVVLASQNSNEASRIYNRMFWETMMYSGVARLVIM